MCHHSRLDATECILSTGFFCTTFDPVFAYVPQQRKRKMEHCGSSKLQNGNGEKMLTLKHSDHPTSLQQQLHSQWEQGEHCDLAISAGSCLLTVHSCIVSCFSDKISTHLLNACTLSPEQSQYNVIEDGVLYCFLNTGEKKIGVNIEEGLLKALVGYMYTGSLSVPYSQTFALLGAAQLLGFSLLVSIIEVFIRRNPGVLRHQAAAPVSGPDRAADHTLQTPGVESSKEESHTAEVSQNDSDNPADTSGVKVKSEIIDLDLQELLDFSAQVEGTKRDAAPVLNDSSLSASETQRKVKNAEKDCEDFVETQNILGKMVKIKQEVVDSDSFPETVPDIGKFHQEDASHSESDLVVNFQSDDAENKVDTEEENDSSAEEQADKTCEDKTAWKKAGSAAFICEYCEQTYSSDARLKQHVMRVHKYKKFLQQVCPRCDAYFEEKEDLKAHCKEIHGDFVCEVSGCDYWTMFPSALNGHQTRIHKNGKHYPCSKCEYVTFDRRTLRMHHAANHAKYSCQICHQAFHLKKNMTRHQRTEHSADMKSSIACPVCHQTFDLKTSMTQHLHEKHSADEYSCPVCHKTFHLKRSFSRHLREVHKNKIDKKQLEKCKQTVGENILTNEKMDFELVQNMTSSSPQHENAETANAEALQAAGIEAVLAAVHSDLGQELLSASSQDDDMMLPPVVFAGSIGKYRKNSRKKKSRTRNARCSFCGKKQENRKMLFQHLRNDHKEECFPCQQCPETFPRKENLTLHVRTKHEHHSWTCSHCDEVFTLATQFTVHSRVQHNDLKPFHCKETPSCRFRASKISNLELHKNHVHAKERNVICQKCGSCFPTQMYLRLHQRGCLQLKQHLCSVCGQVFNQPQALRNHVAIMHGGQRRFVCTQCGRRFSCHANRKRHMRIHNNTFPYMCEICGQKFRHSNSLKDHVRRKH
ncbi:uncharacterized protein LOC143301360 [Babylonia areolata]|uniref:uncharacterized protein LOC143301360 n=1 Tax=Babylonia areolata TaxID=304850 RepID=UPI003FD50B6F